MASASLRIVRHVRLVCGSVSILIDSILADTGELGQVLAAYSARSSLNRRNRLPNVNHGLQLYAIRLLPRLHISSPPITALIKHP